MEEDIKILEEECHYLEELGYLRENNHFIRFNQAIENLIKGYREYKNFYHRRLKEWRTRFENQEKHFLNELDEYDEERENLKKQLENSIPKSKIKEMIEELEKENEETYTKFLASDRANANLSTKGKMIQGAIQVLQELMEDK